MKKLVFTRRAKWSYAIAIAAFLSGLVLNFFGYYRPCMILVIASLSFAIGFAGANGHLSSGEKHKDRDDV